MQTTFPDLDTSGILNTKSFNNISEFLSAVNNARAGDLIILANGTYNVEGGTSFNGRRGTAKNPIIVKAKDVGGAILKGSPGYEFENCEYFTWYGFTHAAKSAKGNDNISFKGGKNNRFARCEVALKDNDNISKRHWLHMSNCKGMRVDHCYFHDKTSEGQFCNVRGTSHNTVEQGPLFEYNYFQNQLFVHPDQEKQGDAGGEGIQMGETDEARFYFRAILRYNYFEKINGDGEIVTNKSSGNIYYNNSFVNNLGTLTLRHGDSTAVLGNYFESSGLRIAGRANLIANNHFTLNSNEEESRRPLVIVNGDWDPGDPDHNERRKWERLVDSDIILNTFANGDGTAPSIIYWGWKNNPLKPTDNKVKGNIITARNGRLLESSDNVTASGNEISDNIGWATGSADYGNLREEMATRKDPLLTRDSDGIYRLQSGSQARNKFTGTPFSSLTNVDIDGENRGPDTDAGSDQFSTESKKPKKRITTADVGPKATTDLGDSPVWNPQPINSHD